MKAVNQAFTTLIGGSRQFIIPVFQRDYSWTPEQCEQLWTDVLRAGEGVSTAASHFMGSIVYVSAGLPAAAFQQWLVIDGQQRLTTLSLLLTALRDHIYNTEWVGGEDSPTEAKIDEYFLKNRLELGDRRYKLALRRHDDATLRMLVDGEYPAEDNSSQHVVDAYDWFAEQLKAEGESDPGLVDRVYRGIGRLEIVDVTLDHSDHPQLVFESLNSTGVDLTQSDLIRNYILMGLGESEQTRLYERYWSKIERDFRDANRVPDFFLRDYIALKTLPPRPNAVSQPRADRIYDEFKEFRRTHPQDLEELLQEMVRFAGYYLDLMGPRADQSALFDAMRHVRALGTTHAVLGMKLYDCHRRAQPSLSRTEFEEALRLIESYVVRRGVLGLQNRAYWDVFADIARSVDEANPLQSMKVAFARRHNYRFPHDASFEREIQETDIYYNTRLCWHILARQENDRQKESSPLKKLTIEHIMPQSVGEVLEWQEMLGENWEETHEVWLNRLGNLTLTACNSEMSNRPFADKKILDCGFAHSAVRLNRYVSEQEQWTEAQMQQRGESLARRSLEIWPYHHANADLVRVEEIKELREKAAARHSGSLKMNEAVRKLLNIAEQKVAELGDVIRIIERKSVSCYAPEFFVEILHMRYYIRLILPLDFDEVEIPDSLYAADTTEWKFVPNRVHTECTMLVDVTDEEQLDEAMPIVRQAYEQATGQS